MCIVVIVCIVVIFSAIVIYVCGPCDLVTLVAGLLSRGQGPEGPATGHLNTGFS